jgi:V/A-type H+/Na+-transporting ATPase subunit A
MKEKAPEGVVASRGKVTKAFGNLLFVEFEDNIRQGEMAFVQFKELSLKAEVLEIKGKEAKVQVFEDTKGIQLGTEVVFTTHLLEAELGPGLISTIFDGLQNPLEKVADASGLFLQRGVYLAAIDRNKHWDFHPVARVGDVLVRGGTLGTVLESRFHHHIMIPFHIYGEVTVTWIAEAAAYNVLTPIAKVVDKAGKETEITMLQKWPIKIPLCQGKKIRATEMMDTGLRIIDTQFPVVKGGTFCAPGPFGAGKTVLQHHLSKYASVDLVVIAACGERAGEVVEMLRTFPHLIDPYNNESLMSRTVIICNTSSMPVAAREASVYMGATIAEYYRQMGLDVLLLADSTSRWAQAMREMSGRLEEIPGEEAFPPYLASRIASFYERSGNLLLANGKKGSLTIGGTVSPAGGNFEEPVTQATLASVGAFHGLSKQRSDARRYPAIDPLISWSKYIDLASAELEEEFEGWGQFIKLAAKTLRAGDEIGKRMEVVGEEGISLEDLITYLKSELYEVAYLQQNAFDKEDAYCPLNRQIGLIKVIKKVFHASFAFHSHDEARSYFLGLQSLLKNMNLMVFESDHYVQTVNKVHSWIENASIRDP